ncbi:MAG TPA: LTA synthase family protein [Stellaceae bacterium]|nr:LTA synthase family protein [Stellaceae bacterium]
MSGAAQIVAGLILALAGWLIPRRIAGARGLGVAALLDAAPLAFVAAVLFVASGRPVFAGAVAFALGAGFAFADRTLRDTLREPVVFTALSELPQVFTHPQLYLPFAGTGTVLGSAAAALLAGTVLLAAEPSVVAPHPRLALFAALAVAAALWRLGHEPWLGRTARRLRRLRPSGAPFADAVRLGPVAMPVAHGIIARAERPARWAALAAPALRGERAAARPIVLVQCESFFDARRALPGLPRDLLAGFDAACADGMHGRLTVPAWGANTTRAEFAVLTGLDEAQLGYDRFNPYHALARRPLASQVWRLRAAGYRTICLHPFDRRFFRRDLAMPALGFETFLGRETLGGGRRPPYRSDPELAGDILRVLGEAGPRTFIFAITMGNHGPWFSEDDGLAAYLAGLRRSDEMIGLLVRGLGRRRDDTLFGFYGDHLPSLPRVFARLGFDDWRSDYAIWGAGRDEQRDIAAHELGRWLADLALAAGNNAVRDAVVAETHGA